MSTPQRRVLAGLEEELLLCAHHQEPELLLQPHRDLHPVGGLGEDGQEDDVTVLVAVHLLRELSEAGQQGHGLVTGGHVT